MSPPSLPPRLQRIPDAEYPRYSAPEMARRRAAVEAAMAQAGCDHLVFCGANRAGSVVQWLTQWPVTAEAVGVLTPGERDALFLRQAASACSTPPCWLGSRNMRRKSCWRRC
jgi:Xaa-Pro dipeptidase